VVRPDIRQILGQDSALRVDGWGELHTSTLLITQVASWGLKLLRHLLKEFDGCAYGNVWQEHSRM
jgi:hypothetical protein